MPLANTLARTVCEEGVNAELFEQLSVLRRRYFAPVSRLAGLSRGGREPFALVELYPSQATPSPSRSRLGLYPGDPT